MSEHYCTHCGYSCEETYFFDGEELCEDCYNEETVLCQQCGRRIWESDACGNDAVLCDDCYNDHYTGCQHCGRTIHNDDAYYIDDDDDYAYCYSCYENHSSGEYIRSYSYKPEPIFYGEGDRYFGVELEIDRGGHYDENAERLAEVANAESKHIYIKSDGSLDEGMEIVTHPMTLEYHTNRMPWADVMEKAKVMGYLSHKTSTCGLHIHINRTTFGSTHEEQDECISRVLFFVERFWQELLKFSRRTESQICRWAARYGIKDSPKDTYDNAKKSRSGRYTSVNLTNYHTIEFRIFRGTLKHNTLVAMLQLVNHICDIAYRMTDEELTCLNWCDFVAGIDEPELVTYLKERRLYVNEPIECEEDI